MVTVRLGMGSPKELNQYGLLRAVNNKGAVSPLTRATARRMPVMSPLLAARDTMPRETFQRGAPKARADSRRVLGPRRSVSAVVRVLTGSIRMASANAPA